MNCSAHNIISKRQGKRDYFIYNLLSAHADILDEQEYKALMGEDPGNKLTGKFIEKGYWTEPGAEKRLFRKKYLEFLDDRENDEVQIFYVPSYHCNFSCSYCYQQVYDKPAVNTSTAVIDAFFHHINRHFSARRKYITLFGGEPLLPGKNNRNLLSFFTKKCAAHNLELAVVTNGYFLNEYLDILQQANIREIQVTLDGPEEIHNQRRPLHNGKGTFQQIVKGIDQALEMEIPINLRVVVDKENIQSLSVLAQFAQEKKWTRNPLFKTQLGRNYELHACHQNPDKLFSRIELWRTVYQLLLQHPELEDFHKPAFSVSRFLSENGKLPAPLFDGCPGAKTEWAFDYTGNIFACTATVGKEGESLGTFYPETRLDQNKIGEWEERDVLNIAHCKTCNLQLACGGGCAAVAKNQYGDVNAPDCRPIKELLELGTSYYF